MTANRGECVIRFTVNEVVDPAVVIDRDHKIIDANGPFMLLFQYSGEELYNLDDPITIHHLVPAEARDRHSANLESLFRTPVVRSMSDPRSKVKGVRKDGFEMPVNVTFYPMWNEVKGAPGDRECVGFSAIVTKRPCKRIPVWREVQNWVPLLIGAASTLGWLLQVPGALELLVGTAGVRVSAGAVSKRVQAGE